MDFIRENYSSQPESVSPVISEDVSFYSSHIFPPNPNPPVPVDVNEPISQTQQGEAEFQELTTFHFNFDDASISSTSDSDSPNDDINTLMDICGKTRKRRKKPEKENWLRNKNIEKRSKGEEFQGCKYALVEIKGKEQQKFKQNITRQAKVIGPRCQGHVKCGSHGYRCSNISEESREILFTKFWKTMNWTQRKVWIPSLIKVEFKERERSETFDCHRENSYKYILKVGFEEIRVCAEMFASTFSLSRRTVLNWVSKSLLESHSEIPKTLTETGNRPEERLSVKQFFQQLPKLPSHYCRKRTSKLYLDTAFQSKAQLFEVYLNIFSKQSNVKASRWTFMDEFKNQNLSIFHPKKDLCDTCVSYKSGNITEEAYHLHIIKKDQVRIEKSRDKKLALKGKLHVIAMDVQAVQQSPLLQANSIYFKSKLNLHNFTIYNLATKAVMCYWWTEVDGDLCASSFASCLVNYIETNFQDQLPLVIYSDGCTSQNRNTTLSNVLLNVAMKLNKPITQKFMEKGHSEMEVDSVHSCIERKKKGREIHVPSDYIKITKEARSQPNQYKCQLLKYDFFSDYSPRKFHRYQSIRPGKKSGDPVVVNLRALQYSTEGTISFKLNLEEIWQKLPHNPSNLDVISAYPKLHSQKLPMPFRKYSDLQDLKSIIPHDCHSFYDNLPHL